MKNNIIALITCITMSVTLFGCANMKPGPSSSDVNSQDKAQNVGVSGEDSGLQDKEIDAFADDKVNQAIKHAEQAEQLYKQGNIKEAKALFHQALELSDQIPMIYYRLGNIAFKEKQFAEAEDYFNKVTEMQPRESKAYYNLAVIHLMKAEENFKYYTASAREDKPVEPRIIRIMNDIDTFASAQLKPRHENPLDKLAETLLVNDRAALPAE